MPVQLILCVETNKRADTDSVYISETIRHWYQLNNRIKLSKVYMNTKSRYCSKAVEKEIAEKSKAFTIGDTKVIYCIDTDQYEKSIEHKKEFHNIRQYCEEHHYDLIWFCHDIEEVFLGKKVLDSQKKQEAALFRRKRKIEAVHSDSLSCRGIQSGASNILNILDQYLSRKTANVL